ncbi:HD-GYP domain-containing protein [Candidatus Latescibacterota bacterium]
MRLSSLENSFGEVLGKSIYQGNGKLLLGAGYRINKKIIDRLDERGVSHVYIMEEGTEEVIPEDVISDEIRLQAKSQLADKVSTIGRQYEFADLSRDKALKLLKQGYLRNIKITYDMRLIVEEMLKDISSTGAKILKTVLIKGEETYFLDHAINVAVISILIGKMYRFTKPELLSLALGSLLHDIGKVIIDQINKSDDSKIAKNLYPEHPTFGYLLVSENVDISPMESQIVNQHHEYQDGSGFPIGLNGQNLPPQQHISRERKGTIYRMAEICCVANAFDNLVFNPITKEQMGPEEAMKKLISEAKKIYNADIIQTLLKVVPIYPVGATIKVTSIVDPLLIGYFGVVAKINEKDINKPVIILTKDKFMKKIKPKVIDTSKLTNVKFDIIM